MTQASFYWHDYETWGANPRSDRPAQFAGIRTDAALNIIGQSLMIYSRPTADFLPSPEAVLITGITPQQAYREGIAEAEFFRQIHAEFATPGTCITGYNNLRFDDEVTRFGFYRNFIDPYAYSWQNSNSRWDILDLMRLAHALRPQGIQWPQNDDGKTSFKLTDLTAANGIEQQGAHDALVDVTATIDVARLVKKQQPRLFDFYFGLRHKRRAAELLNLSQPQIVLHVSGMFPVEQGCIAPIIPLLTHPANSNEIICYNLRINPEKMLSLSADEIHHKLYQKNIDIAPGEQRLALKGVHLNKSPALAPLNTLTDEMAQQWQIDWNEIKQHHQMLLQDATLLSKLKTVYGQPREPVENDADIALYDGFISNEDRLRCNQVLAMTPDQLITFDADQFTDPRLRVLFFRYRARNYPQTLNADETLRWQRFCQSRLMDGEFGASLTLQQFQQQLLTLTQQDVSEREQRLLQQLALWAEEIFA